MSSPFESSAPVITAPLAPTPPHWVREYLTREQPPPLTLLTAQIPNATALGASGLSDAVADAYRTLLCELHALAADAPGVPIETPRQVPAYRYSSRYGLRPPCFARATKCESTLFIGGTASIIGEDTRHVAAIAAQTEETLSNLRALIAAAAGVPPDRALRALRHVRVHVSSARHTPIVSGALERVVSCDATLEFVEAQLCRQELLVEIEGVAVCA